MEVLTILTGTQLFANQQKNDTPESLVPSPFSANGLLICVFANFLLIPQNGNVRTLMLSYYTKDTRYLFPHDGCFAHNNT